MDVIISNCVINLSADKDRVLREAFRVLKPGGRFAVSDVVVHGDVPAEVRHNVLLWVGCIAGALQDTEYISKLGDAGFEAIEIEATRVHNVEDARVFLHDQGVDVEPWHRRWTANSSAHLSGRRSRKLQQRSHKEQRLCRDVTTCSSCVRETRRAPSWLRRS